MRTPPRRLLRRGPVLLRRPARAAVPGNGPGDHRRQLPALPASRSRGVPALVPDGRPPAGGPVHRQPQLQRAGRPAGAAARAGQAVRRAHPRAEQPRRRRGPGDRRAARAVRRHAAQAGAAVRGQARRRGAALAHGLQEDFVARIGGPRRPLGRWSAPTARTRSATGSRSTTSTGVGAGRGVRRGRAGRDDLDRVAGAGRRRHLEPALRWLGLHGGDRDRCWPRSPTARAGSPPWSTRPSSTPRWTARRTSRPTCTPASTPRW